MRGRDLLAGGALGLGDLGPRLVPGRLDRLLGCLAGPLRSASCSVVRWASSSRAVAASARAASASDCAVSACPAISSAIWLASSARRSAESRAAFSRAAAARASPASSSASATCAEICAAAASGSPAVVTASASCSAVSRSAAASCSARSSALPAVLTASATGVRAAWLSSPWGPSPGRVLARHALSGLCTGWPGTSACSQYTGAGPRVPRRGAGGRGHRLPGSYSHRHVSGPAATGAGSSRDVISLMLTILTHLISSRLSNLIAYLNEID